MSQCPDCKGAGHFVMMSEFYVPCSTCKGNGKLPDKEVDDERDLHGSGRSVETDEG